MSLSTANMLGGKYIKKAYLEKAAIVFLKSFSLLSKSVPIYKSVVLSQSYELTRGPPELAQHFHL
jgi:hypothetical protein